MDASYARSIAQSTLIQKYKTVERAKRQDKEAKSEALAAAAPAAATATAQGASGGGLAQGSLGQRKLAGTTLSLIHI